MKIFIAFLLAGIGFSAMAVTIPSFSPDEIRHLREEVRQASMALVNEQMYKLTMLGREHGIEMSSAQRTLAYEILYGITKVKIGRKLVAKHQHIELQGPTTIWVNTLKGAGNSTLLPLIAEVLTGRFDIQYLPRTRIDFPNHTIQALRDHLQNDTTLILENFSEYYAANHRGKTPFFFKLVENIKESTIVLAVNDQPTITPAGENPKTISHFTPPLNNQWCELTLSPPLLPQQISDRRLN
jgi:hypothetical protein